MSQTVLDVGLGQNISRTVLDVPSMQWAEVQRRTTAQRSAVRTMPGKNWPHSVPV